MLVTCKQLSPYFALCHSKDLDYVELFAGGAAVSAALRELHLVGHSHDFSYDGRTMDILSPAGFSRLAYVAATRVALCFPLVSSSLCKCVFCAIAFAICELQRLALVSMFRLRPGAVVMMAPVCSSWVWICRSTSPVLIRTRALCYVGC